METLICFLHNKVSWHSPNVFPPPNLSNSFSNLCSSHLVPQYEEHNNKLPVLLDHTVNVVQTQVKHQVRMMEEADNSAEFAGDFDKAKTISTMSISTVWVAKVTMIRGKCTTGHVTGCKPI